MRERNDRAGDQIPIVIQRKGDHRLNVEGVAERVAAPAAEVEIVLDRHAGQIGDRVGELLRESRVAQASLKI
jgi:hypothetical protein